MEELNFRIKCRFCGVEGTQELFVKDKTQKTGYRDKCKCCHNAKNVEWRKDNIELNREIQREYGKRYIRKNKNKKSN